MAVPDNVRRIIVAVTSAYITRKETEAIQTYRNIDSWPKAARDTAITFYAKEYLEEMWNDWVDAVLRIAEKRNGDFCKKISADNQVSHIDRSREEGFNNLCRVFDRFERAHTRSKDRMPFPFV